MGVQVSKPLPHNKQTSSPPQVMLVLRFILTTKTRESIEISQNVSEYHMTRAGNPSFKGAKVLLDSLLYNSLPRVGSFA